MNNYVCKDSIFRSVVKTLFFKLITTSITAIFTGVGNAIMIHLILTVVYLVYERIWNKVNWGRIEHKEYIPNKINSPANTLSNGILHNGEERVNNRQTYY